jgi:hypothetical protein
MRLMGRLETVAMVPLRLSQVHRLQGPEVVVEVETPVVLLLVLEARVAVVLAQREQERLVR